MFAECANRGFPRLPRGGGAPTPRPEGLRPRTPVRWSPSAPRRRALGLRPLPPCGGHLWFAGWGLWGFAPCPVRWSPLVRRVQPWRPPNASPTRLWLNSGDEPASGTAPAPAGVHVGVAVLAVARAAPGCRAEW